MDLSRRRMLQAMLAAGVAAAAPLRWGAPAGAAAAGKGTTGASWLSRSSFLPLVGAPFRVATGRTGPTLTLPAIRDLTPQPVKERANVADGRFSLLFTSGVVMAQGMKALHHDALGDASLFVTPIGARGTSSNDYELIVNRL